MGIGKGALLWLIGIPLPIILLLAIFMHHRESKPRSKAGVSMCKLWPSNYQSNGQAGVGSR